MAFRPNSQARRVTDFLATGKTLTPAQARTKFGVSNFRALISHIAETVERYGNHEVYRETSVTGASRYGMDSN